MKLVFDSHRPTPIVLWRKSWAFAVGRAVGDFVARVLPMTVVVVPSLFVPHMSTLIERSTAAEIMVLEGARSAWSCLFLNERKKLHASPLRYQVTKYKKKQNMKRRHGWKS